MLTTEHLSRFKQAKLCKNLDMILDKHPQTNRLRIPPSLHLPSLRLTWGVNADDRNRFNTKFQLTLNVNGGDFAQGLYKP